MCDVASARRTRPAICMAAILALIGAPAAQAVQLYYIASGSETVTVNLPAGFGASASGTILGSVWFDYSNGMLSVISSSLTTVSGQSSQGNGLNNPPTITDLTGTSIAFSGSEDPFAPSNGQWFTMTPSWPVTAAVVSELSFPAYQGISIIGTPQDLANNVAGITINFVHGFSPTTQASGSLRLVPPIPEPSTALLLGWAFCIAWRRGAASPA